MVEKKHGLNLDVTEMLQEKYVPSESERKKVLLYYFLFGIIITLSKKNISKYEFFHLRQSIGWWTVFFLFFVITIVLFFIPFVKIIPILFYLAMLIVWFIFIKQSWEGKYTIDLNSKDSRILFPFFVGIGNWILKVFDLKFNMEK